MNVPSLSRSVDFQWDLCASVCFKFQIWATGDTLYAYRVMNDLVWCGKSLIDTGNLVGWQASIFFDKNGRRTSTTSGSLVQRQLFILTSLFWQICCLNMSDHRHSGNARMIDMPYGLDNPSAVEKSAFGADLAIRLQSSILWFNNRWSLKAAKACSILIALTPA